MVLPPGTVHRRHHRVKMVVAGAKERSRNPKEESKREEGEEETETETQREKRMSGRVAY